MEFVIFLGIYFFIAFITTIGFAFGFEKYWGEDSYKQTNIELSGTLGMFWPATLVVVIVALFMGTASHLGRILGRSK